MPNEGGEATEKVVVQQPALAASPEPPTLTEKKSSPEQVLVTTNNTIASQPPTDAAKSGTVEEASSANKTVVAKTPTLAPTPVEPVDITQSIVAEAESRRTTLDASPVTPSQPKIASTETSLHFESIETSSSGNKATDHEISSCPRTHRGAS